MASIGIVIVCHSNSSLLDSCIKSLIDQALPSEFEIKILVVDTSGSSITDNCSRMSKSNARFELRPENLGYGWALNVGVKALGETDFLILSNSDVEYSPGFLLNMLNAFRNANGLMAPLQFERARDSNPHHDTLLPNLSLADSLSRWLFVNRQKSIANRLSILNKLLSAKEDGVVVPPDFSVSGAVLWIDVDLFHRIGGMPESTFLQEEDRLLVHRVRKVGAPISLVTSARVEHVGGMRHGSATLAQLRIQMRSEITAWRELDARMIPFARLIIGIGLFLRVTAIALRSAKGIPRQLHTRYFNRS